MERTIWLRLKLIADAGLVGLPNAGKSTFLAAVVERTAEDRGLSLHDAASRARAWSGWTGAEFVLADIPGLIEGAHEGKGLGDPSSAMSSAARCCCIWWTGPRESIAEDYRVIARELEAYGAGLAEKPRIVGAQQDRRAGRGHGRGRRRRSWSSPRAAPVLRVSGATGAGRDRGAAGAPRRRRGRARAGTVGREGKGAMEAVTLGGRGSAAARRIVVKIGSALLVDQAARAGCGATGLTGLAADVAALRGAGKDVILVSSGSIALGRRALKLPDGDAVAGAEPGGGGGRADPAGAGLRGRCWRRTGMTTAQVLVTLEDSENRRRYLNTRATLGTLLDLGAVPIVNENDTVATDEIRYGDNDRLAAQVASMAGADVLVLLSDVDGLYTANPQLDPAARRLDVVRAVTPEIEAMAGGAGSALSRGRHEDQDAWPPRPPCGRAAPWRSPKARVARPLSRARRGRAPAPGSRPHGDPHAARKRWISGDEAARAAHGRRGRGGGAAGGGKSLLPAGVTGVEGGFQRGDPVRDRGAGRGGGGRGARGLRCGRGARDHGPPLGPDRRRCSAIRGARRWSIATTWRSEGRERHGRDRHRRPGADARRSARSARAAAPRSPCASAAQKDAALQAAADAIRAARASGSLAANAARHGRRREAKGVSGRDARPAEARRGAGRGDGRGPARHRRAARSGGAGDRGMGRPSGLHIRRVAHAASG